MVQGQIFLKGGLSLFLFNFSKVLSFLHLEIALSFAKLHYTGKITLLIFVSTKEGWLVGLGQEWVALG